VIQVLVMGVSGVGKSTVGRLLAEALQARFIEADDFHTQSNFERMAAGIPLDDESRGPWLKTIAAEMSRSVMANEPVVLACSALKSGYRSQILGGCPNSRIICLRADEALLRQRLQARKNHFMPATLLQSQLETLELPTDALLIDLDPDMSPQKSVPLALEYLLGPSRKPDNDVVTPS
jgi:carbohydrate kinase (thermoresistant glucokinase family)